MQNTGIVTYILPTQHLAEQLLALLKSEHLDIDRMLTYAASYIEHENDRAAGCIFEESIADDLYGLVEGFDSDPPGDTQVLAYTQYAQVRNRAEELANQCILAGKVLKPVIETFINFDIYESHTTSECRFLAGDVALRLKCTR